MSKTGAYVSPSGVQIAADFRDNLIIDRYHSTFASMRQKKRDHMRSVNSEDAVTWNVFQSLKQINPVLWLPSLFASAFESSLVGGCERALVTLWKTIEPPPSLLKDGPEGETEVDVIIEAPEFLWLIEAKLNSDVSTRTTTREGRNQILRNIDVGSYHAGVKSFYFSLLVKSEKRSPAGADIVNSYATLQEPRNLLANHRPDGLTNLKGVSLLTWSQLATIVTEVAAGGSASDPENGYAKRLLVWLEEKGIKASSTKSVKAS